MKKQIFLSLALLLAGALAVKAQTQQVKVVSVLEIYDMETGSRSVVHEFAPNEKMEAPNWTKDGKYLVYNSGGRIYKIPVDGGTPVLINTDYVKSCNNDHVLSPDGKQLAVSSSIPGYRGSYIFTLPLDGGVPRIITAATPSYLHGWSPDGKTLAFCGQRPGNDDYDVWTIDLETGKETQLTKGGGLDDGPEYSPDGKYIWFNSVRSGLMQIYRMKADGSEQTQMTFDEDRNSWFAHISPDGKYAVYLTYRKGDLEPGQHVANKNVDLRLLSTDGGKPQVLVNLFGGQGTINVNSWSPDSKKFAFVSYRIVE